MMPSWDDWKLFAAPGCLLGPIPMLAIWPDGLEHALFFAGLGTAIMCAFAHRNGRFLPRCPVVAWSVILFLVPAPFVIAIYVLTKSGRSPLDDSMFHLVVIYLSTLAADGALAWVHGRTRSRGRLAAFLRAIEPPGQPGCPRKARRPAS